MLLIGQFDSPFVRRIGITLELYGIAYDHSPLSVFRNADELARYNPMRRVPTLVLDDGEVLIESAAIVDYLDERVGRDAAMIAPSGAERRKALKIVSLSTGLSDKAVALIYERVLHETTSQAWIERCRGQVAAVLDALEVERAGRTGPFLFGEKIGHADIALGCALRFLREGHPALFDASARPALAAHNARCEDLPAFRKIQQAFIPPA